MATSSDTSRGSAPSMAAPPQQPVDLAALARAVQVIINAVRTAADVLPHGGMLTRQVDEAQAHLTAATTPPEDDKAKGKGDD